MNVGKPLRRGVAPEPIPVPNWEAPLPAAKPIEREPVPVPIGAPGKDGSSDG